MSARAGARRASPYPIALAIVLWTVGMLFTAFTVALLVRRGSPDWVRVPLPSIVWLNTAVLALSSLAFELGRRRFATGDANGSERWLGVASLLGVLFLAGQILAWRSLAARGVFLPTNPHASFFYMLSAVHGAHVVGGLGAIFWTLRHARGATPPWKPIRYVATYWHFVGVVWLWLLGALSIL